MNSHDERVVVGAVLVVMILVLFLVAVACVGLDDDEPYPTEPAGCEGVYRSGLCYPLGGDSRDVARGGGDARVTIVRDET